MKISYPLIAFIFLLLNGCSDYSSDSSEYELSGKMYVCDGSVQGDIINDSKFGKKYCNGDNWITLIPEDSVSEDSTPVMYECENGEVVKYKDLCTKNPSDYLPLDDSEYPYAGIPRIVIETKRHRKIIDRETEIPAKLQIWGEKAPKSEIMELTIRGRGNTSWTDMPKKSYKIEFTNKQSVLGMPKDKDWALISNYADKTLMKNYLMYNLSRNLGAYYSPRCEFAELFINQEYLGLYLLTEKIKLGKNRIDLPKNVDSYIIEFDAKIREDEQAVVSYVLVNNGTTFRIHTPKSATDQEQNLIKQHIVSFEKALLETTNSKIENHIDDWIDFDEAIRHFWVQEISKNTTAFFYTSVYFSWTPKTKIRMGPVWDFDLAFGVVLDDKKKSPSGWHLNTDYWYKYLFQNNTYEFQSYKFWETKRDIIFESLNSIDSLYKFLEKTARNNFKKWPILKDKDYMNPNRAYASYVDGKAYFSYYEAVADLKEWFSDRIIWLDEEVNKNTTSNN